MSGVKAANEMCTCVFDGDMPLLRRLVAAGIPIDASDYVSGHMSETVKHTKCLKKMFLAHTQK